MMIGRKSFLVFISRTLNRFFEGIFYFIAVYFFLPDQFGYQRVVLSIMGIFSLFSILGLATPHLKIMADEKNKNQNDAFATFFIIELILIFISTIIIFSMFYFQISSGLISDNIEQKSSFFILFAQYFILAINMIFELSYRANLNVAKTEIPIIAGNIGRVIYLLIIFLIFRNFLVYLFGNLLFELIKLIFYLSSKRTFRFGHFNYKIFKRYFLLNLYFLVPIILNGFSRNLGPFFFLIHFDEELLGIYSVISMFFAAISSIEDTFRSLLIPSFSNILSKRDSNTSISKFIVLFEKYMLCINGFLIIGGILFAEFFLKRFLGEIYYSEGIYFFYVYLISLISYPLYSPFSSLIVAAEKMKFYTVIVSIAFIFSFLSWLFLIPIFGIIGINLGLWISLIISLILTRIYCHKNFKVGKMNKKTIIHLIVLSLFIIFSFFIASMHLTLILSIVTSIVTFIGYTAFLLISKTINKTDIEFIKNILNPKEMFKYLKQETLNDKSND